MPMFLVTEPLVCKQTYRVEALTKRMAIKKAQEGTSRDVVETGEDNCEDGKKLWSKATAEED